MTSIFQSQSQNKKITSRNPPTKNSFLVSFVLHQITVDSFFDTSPHRKREKQEKFLQEQQPIDAQPKRKTTKENKQQCNLLPLFLLVVLLGYQQSKTLWINNRIIIITQINNPTNSLHHLESWINKSWNRHYGWWPSPYNTDMWNTKERCFYCNVKYLRLMQTNYFAPVLTITGLDHSNVYTNNALLMRYQHTKEVVLLLTDISGKIQTLAKGITPVFLRWQRNNTYATAASSLLSFGGWMR